jgi:uncharacterized membrane protein YfcA
VPQGGLLYMMLLGTGLVAGTLNVIAGGGSFLTLPILILMGLPATMANGTNRVGILLQNVAAVWSFRRHGLIERRWVVAAALPATGGAVAGTMGALWIGDEAFKRILAFLMIAVTLWTLWDPLKPRAGNGAEVAARAGAGALAAGFFLAGIYGGFVQAGVGFLLLAASTLAGYDLVRGNAMKVLCVLVFTPVSLGLFAWQGQVAWLPGLALAVGSILGGLLGVRLTVLKGHRWLKAVVTVMVIALAVRLWFSG